MRRPHPVYLTALFGLLDSAPEEGEAWEKIADDYQKIIMPGITHW